MSDLQSIKYVVGIDFGSTASGVSIAHVDDPFNIITVLTWEDSQKRSQKFYSSIFYPNDDNDHPLYGMKREDVGDKGVYVDKIGQYLVDLNASDEKLNQLMNGLTIKKVVTDYLKYFVELALQRLKTHDKVVKNTNFTKFISEDFTDEDIETVCYCVVCPTFRQEFIEECFIEARIIEKSEANHRLSFITEAVATAHHQLSLERGVSKIQNDQKYLVCDVGDISIGLAKIHAATTESLSVVTSIYDDLTQGSINLETNFKNHLIDNMADLNLDNILIDQFVDKFLEIKYAFTMDTPDIVAISLDNSNGDTVNFTYADLNRIVFEPFVESITDLISNAEEANNQCDLFLSGKYGADTHFIERLTAKNAGELTYHYHTIDDKLEKVSSGAVSSILNTCKSQTPFFLNNEHRFLYPDKEWSLPEKDLEESTDNNNGNDAYDFIVGIDFGTTFSGCSYVQLKDKKGKPITTENIKTIKENWPGGNLLKFGKTPTLLMYDKKMKPKYWGEEARIQAKHHKNLNLLGNFKLFLCPESLENFYGHTNDLEELKEQGGFGDDEASKTEVHAVKVIASYLKLFKNHIIEHIVSKEMDESFSYFTRSKLLKKYKMRYVITVPAMWNSSARDTMAQAAIEASIIKKNEINQLLIISEPEAAALFCEKRFTKYFKKVEETMDNTNFIVCDAGGGTVDLVTFNLQLNKKDGDTPTTDPMICQIGDGIGDTCGSTYLDVRFKNYLFEFYKKFGVNIDRENVPLDDVMRDFVTNHKPDFMPNLQGDTYYDINLPGRGIINFTGDSTYRMANGNKTLKMKNQDMKEEIFDPIVNRIFALIDDQFKQAEKIESTIDAILMVGGFSQSKYLQQRIKDQYKGVCHVSVPFEGVTAISHGAVSYALNPRMISKKSAGQSLGLEVQAPFYKELANSLEKKVIGPNGVAFERGCLEYFVEKNQPLEGERRKIYQKDVFVQYPNAAIIAIFSCDSKTGANNRYVTTNHVKIMEAKIIMPSVNKRDGDLVKFKVSLKMEHIGVSVTIECQDPVINEEVKRITNNSKASLKIKPKCNLNVANSKQSLISYSLAKTGYLFNIRETTISN
ncbi:uncharacterized protein EV154DRAFT_526595 [Mucor mucedo]|uniref:uncharacterized protein n=1 Tax=Mucor mucedo TaxID=29922 RepID=UPI002220524B|nr:uncharacterized protein EV154DRAFT_526595 [Mucor mucedo]KAI7875539.1 hypothetical protein EV154DRAFT_526595 [Mucor mucedo]